MENHSETLDCLSTLAQKSSSKEDPNIKSKIKEEINKIGININLKSDSLPVLPHILTTLKNANSLLTSKEESIHSSFKNENSISGRHQN